MLNAFGVEEIARSIVVFEDDPGWMNGYAFELGDMYFIPLQTTGPNGEANYSFACDPITQMHPSTAAQLPALAVRSIPIADPTVTDVPDTNTTTLTAAPTSPTAATDTTPSSSELAPQSAPPPAAIGAPGDVAPQSSETTPRATPAESESGNATWAWVLTVVAVLLAAGVVSVLFVGRRRRITATSLPV